MCSNDMYSEIIPYDPQIHPRNSKDYPGPKVKDTETFIMRAEWTHGRGRFDYSEAEYVKSNQKVNVICNGGEEHPDPFIFVVRPNDLISGKGCPKCSKKYRWTTEEWVEEVNKKWDGAFDYSEVEYKNAFTKVWITHKECGTRFSVTADNHMRGRGCPNCKRTKPPKYSTEEYINELVSAKGIDRYDTSKVDLVNSKTAITLKCNIHDIWFTASPYYILKDGTEGCPKCTSSRKSREVWIESAKETHPDREYDYSNVEEKPSGKQQIYCRKHDHFFWLTYSQHIRQATKCKWCSADERVGGYSLADLGAHDPDCDAILYHVEITNKETLRRFRKIGVTKQTSAKKRFGAGTFSRHYEVNVLDEIQMTLYDALISEKSILSSLDEIGSRFLEHELKGNHAGGWTECYRYNDEEAKKIVNERIEDIRCHNTT